MFAKVKPYQKGITMVLLLIILFVLIQLALGTTTYGYSPPPSWIDILPSPLRELYLLLGILMIINIGMVGGVIGYYWRSYVNQTSQSKDRD